MRNPLVYCSDAMTGYGLTFGLRHEFDGAINCHGFASTEDIGTLDAPLNIPAGSMARSESSIAGNCIQSFAYRGSF